MKYTTACSSTAGQLDYSTEAPGIQMALGAKMAGDRKAHSSGMDLVLAPKSYLLEAMTSHRKRHCKVTLLCNTSCQHIAIQNGGMPAGLTWHSASRANCWRRRASLLISCSHCGGQSRSTAAMCVGSAVRAHPPVLHSASDSGALCCELSGARQSVPTLCTHSAANGLHAEAMPSRAEARQAPQTQLCCRGSTRAKPPINNLGDADALLQIFAACRLHAGKCTQMQALHAAARQPDLKGAPHRYSAALPHSGLWCLCACSAHL